MGQTLGIAAQAGMNVQEVSNFRERKAACSKRIGKDGKPGTMGMYGLFSQPKCYVDGKVVDLLNPNPPTQPNQPTQPAMKTGGKTRNKKTVIKKKKHSMKNR